jgi:DNA-binding transcriptional regulator YiaG
VVESLQRQRTHQQIETSKPEGKRFSSRSVRTHRRRLGISAADYGKLIGVTGKTVYTWEQGNARPRGGAFGRWVALRALGKRAALAMLAQKKPQAKQK